MSIILYFSMLLDKRASSKEVGLAQSVTDVRALLAWRRTRSNDRDKALKEDTVQVTVN